MSSSSSSRKRTEHIERTRYPNPLPLPPYPPKQLAINTPPSRYVDPRLFGQRLAASVPLPMVVDAEAGMPLDMTSFPACWYTDQELADADAQGRGGVFPILDRSQVQIDEEDAFLLSDLMSTSTTINGATAADGLDGTATPERGQPTWLKRTEYLAAAEKKARRSELASRHANVENIDASREAQLARIKVTFEAANQPLETLRHPTKGHLRAVDAFPLLPDTDTWATRVDVFRFGDAPGRHIDNRPAHDPRLQTAILRPHQDTLGQPLYSLFAIDAPEAEDIVEQQDEDMFGSGDEAEDDDDDNDDEDRPKKAKAPKTRRAFRSREEQLAAEDAESRRAVDARIRGMKTDAEKQDVQAEVFETADSEERPIHMALLRDYETHDESMRKDQELIVSFLTGPSRIERDDANGAGPEAGEANNGVLPPLTAYEKSFQTKRGDAVRGGNVALYHPVSMRASLRVKRRRPIDPQPPEHWDAINLGKRSVSTYEKIERLHERKVVDDLDLGLLPERIPLPEPIEEEAEETVGEEGVEGPADAIDEVEKEDENGDDDEESRATSSQKAHQLADEGAGGAEEDDEEDEEDEDGEPSLKERKRSKAGSGSDSDDEDDEEGSDEGMDDDELEALRAEAGADAAEDEGADEAVGARRSRRGPRPVSQTEEAEKEDSLGAEARGNGADEMDVDEDA